MTNVLKLLKMGTALILACIAFGMILYIYNLSKDTGKTSREELETRVTDFGIEDLIQNENIDISGAKVVVLAEKYCKSFPIVLVTGEIPTGFYDISFIRESTNPQYINPNKIFRLKIDRDKNNEPLALIFVQSGCSTPAYDISVAAQYMNKSQLLYSKLLAERDLQMNLHLYKESLKKCSEEEYKRLVRDGVAKDTLYWESLRDAKKDEYEANSEGLR